MKSDVKNVILSVRRFGSPENGYKLKVCLTPANAGRRGGEIESENDEKLSSSISRARSAIFELAFCNTWDWFFTGTLSPEKYDRSNLEKFHKDITQFIGNQNKNHNCKIQFLLVPELHKDRKSWHMHGFLRGIPEKQLHKFQLGDTMSSYIAYKVRWGQPVYNWLPYSKKFGFCDLEPITSAEPASKYVTKYINKDLAHSVSEVGAHMYYCSRGLERAQHCGSACWFGREFPFEKSYEGDYADIYFIDDTPENRKIILSRCYDESDIDFMQNS